uniref:Uncharacterized protein n=1 Tax=Oryza glumipatula TaxID=40148 RepID=A0A0E0BK82_9ORYZ
MEKAVARTQKVVRSDQKSVVTISRNTRCSNFILKLMAKERRGSRAGCRRRCGDRGTGIAGFFCFCGGGRGVTCAHRQGGSEQGRRCRWLVRSRRRRPWRGARGRRGEAPALAATGSSNERSGACARRRHRSGRRMASRRRGEITLDAAPTSPTPCRRRPPRPPETTTMTPSS